MEVEVEKSSLRQVCIQIDGLSLPWIRCDLPGEIIVPALFHREIPVGGCGDIDRHIQGPVCGSSFEIVFEEDP